MTQAWAAEGSEVNQAGGAVTNCASRADMPLGLLKAE
jgi:hypothetical protein